MALRWPAKDPNEILDFEIDWTRRLWSETEQQQYKDAIAADRSKKDDPPASVVAPADEIRGSQFILPTQSGDDQLVANLDNPSTYSETRTKIWLEGGVEGEIYLIENRVTTLGGRTMDQTIKLKVKTK